MPFRTCCTQLHFIFIAICCTASNIFLQSLHFEFCNGRSLLQLTWCWCPNTNALLLVQFFLNISKISQYLPPQLSSDGTFYGKFCFATVLFSDFCLVWLFFNGSWCFLSATQYLVTSCRYIPECFKLIQVALILIKSHTHSFQLVYNL